MPLPPLLPWTTPVPSAPDFAWLAEWLEVRRTVGFVCFVSASVSAALAALYTLLPRWRKTPGWLMQRAIGLDLVSALSLLVFFHVWCPKSVDLLSGEKYRDLDVWEVQVLMMKLKALMVCFLAAEAGANSWRLVMFLHLVVIYRNPFNPDRSAFVYPAIVILLTVLGTSICAPAVWQNVHFEAGIMGNIEIQPVIIFPVLIYPAFFVAASSVVQVGVWSAIRSDRSGQRHASVSYAARERLTRHGFAYLSLHALQLGLGLTVLGLLQLTSWRQPWLWHATMVIMCGRPLLSHLGWFLLYGPFGRRALSVFRWEETPVAANVGALGSSREAAAPGQQLPVAVQLADLDPAAKSSPSPSRSLARRRMTAPSRTLAHLGSGLESSGGRSVSQGMPGPRIGAHELMSELRFEVLYDVARSIGDNAQRQLQLNALHERTNAPARTGPASCIGFGAAPSAAGEQMEPADSAPVLSSAGLLSWPQRLAPGTWHTRSAEPSGSRGAVHHQADDFAAIREAFDISPQQYARDFPNDLSRLNSRWVQKLRESVSEGASGSFFYRVLSDSAKGVSSRFIVKEISRAEKNTLTAILPAYRRHVQERGGRSFIQYFGCHSVPLRWKYAARVHFVVMRNFLPVQMWLVFDLKGATANRRALKGNTLLEVQKGGGGAQEKTSYGTLRDWEWMDIAMVVDVAPEDKVEIAETLRADSEFLSRQGLLDYSMLVGIHRLPKENSSTHASREERISQLLRVGGYVSLDRQKVYFFGIIDVLEAYSVRWRAQHAVLTAAYHLIFNGANADGISALKPELYGDRFYTFMLKEVLQLDASGCQEQEEDGLEEDDSIFAGTCFDEGPSFGLARWGKLWRRRRRGLVRERMEVERVDFLRRIEELEQELEGLRSEARAAGAAGAPGSASPAKAASARYST